MKGEIIDRTLGIIAWGLILFALFVILLKLLGIIGSPPVIEILLGGVLAELLRIETKFKEFNVKLNLLWDEFKKRKEL